MRRFLPWLITVSLISSSGPIFAGPAFHYDSSGINLKARLIKFPGKNNESLGAFTVAHSLDERNPADKCGLAQGVVNVPAGRFTWLVANNRLYENPDLLNQLPPDSINKLTLAASALEENGDALCDRVMKRVECQQSILALDLSRSDVTDSGVAGAASLSNLQSLSLFMNGLRGSFLEKLTVLKRLRKLDLRRNGVLPGYLLCLANNRSLEYLDLGQNNLNDGAVRNLSKCTGLSCLILAGNREVTDASLPSLRNLKKLSYLGLNGTRATLRGVMTSLKGLPLKHLELTDRRHGKEELAQVQKAFPGVEVIFVPDALKVDKYTHDLFAPLH